MRRTVAVLVGLQAAASAWLGCDQIFGLSEANVVPYPEAGGADATTAADTGADSSAGHDSTTGPDGADAGGGGDGASGDSSPADSSSGDSAPVDAAVETGPVCNPVAAWSEMFDAAIVPPFQMAGLDLRGADDAGITIQEIRAAACQLVDGGDVPPGEWNAYWGGDGSPGGEVVSVNYDPTSGRFAEVFIFGGYTGGLDFHGADGGAYHVGLTGDITKNDASFPLDWADWNTDASTLEGQVTELRNAMVATYAPGTPASANCKLDQTCNVGPGGSGTGFFGVRAPLFFYAAFNDTINHPSEPSYFYASTNFLQFHDPGQANLWLPFDTTQLGTGVNSFAGLVVLPQNAMYLVPSGATPFARFDLTSDAFANASAGAWSTFDPSQLAPKPQGFAGGGTDMQFAYFAGTSGVCAQYDSTASFVDPAAWSTFDTKTLPAPAGKAFAGVAMLSNATPLFVPSQDGVVAMYSESTLPSDFTVASNWLTYDLTQVNPRLKQFYGAVSLEYGNTYPVYLVPNKDTMFAEYVGWPTLPNTAAAWIPFDVSTVAGAAAPGYSTGVHDQVRYVYFAPSVSGYSPVRYDTTQPFNSASAWEVGVGTIDINVKATGFDGRYVYFAGESTTVVRYDTTQSFTKAPTAWTTYDVHAYDTSVVGFGATGNDGRYQYFIPQASSVAMRFDSRFGPPLPRATWSSF